MNYFEMAKSLKNRNPCGHFKDAYEAVRSKTFFILVESNKKRRCKSNINQKRALKQMFEKFRRTGCG